MLKFFLLILFFPAAALAEKIPSYLVNGNIEVQTNDGIKRKYSSNDFKMVSREQAERARIIVIQLRAELAETKHKLKRLRSSIRVEANRTVVLNNRFTVHAGLGPAGLQRRKVDGGQIIKPKRDPVMGFSFSRRLYQNVNLGMTAITSQNIKSATFTGGIGFDW